MIDRASPATARSSRGCSTSPTTSTGAPAQSCRRTEWSVATDDDTYLVVAADKGTATFSDLANEVAARVRLLARRRVRVRWLGRLRPQGDGHHRQGAWESVKRHFRELGVDTQTEDFTVVGIGDMSGDVFGNGMLLSRHIRLVAAFDHRHIFLDPTRTPRARSPSGSGCSHCRDRRGRTTTRR